MKNVVSNFAEICYHNAPRQKRTGALSILEYGARTEQRELLSRARNRLG